MTFTLIVENFISGTNTTVCFSDSDFDVVNKHWTKPDKLLREINKQGYFDGKSTWNELSPEHWYVLVTRNLERVLSLEPKKQGDHKNKTVESFHFLVMGLVKCFEHVTQTSVDTFRIQVLKNSTFNFQVQNSYFMNFSSNNQKANAKPALSVVVDNTEGNNGY